MFRTSRASTAALFVIVGMGTGCAGSVDLSDSDRASVDETAAMAVSAYLGPVTFAWPLDCSVPVTETVEKNDDVVVISFSVTASDGPRGLEVAFSDTTVVSVNNQKVTAAENSSLSPYFSYPTMIVDRGPNAELLDVNGYFAAEQRLEESGVAHEFAVNYMDQLWSAWVSAWSNTDIEESVVESISSEGEPAETTKLESRPTATGTAHLVFERVTTDAGPEVLSAVSDLIGPEPSDLEQINLTGTFRVSTMTDPTTLMPSVAEHEIRFSGAGEGELVDARKRRVWLFDWKASNCPA